MTSHRERGRPYATPLTECHDYGERIWTHGHVQHEASLIIGDLNICNGVGLREQHCATFVRGHDRDCSRGSSRVDCKTTTRSQSNSLKVHLATNWWISTCHGHGCSCGVRVGSVIIAAVADKSPGQSHGICPRRSCCERA